jgi:hypothetical protein
MTLSQKQRQFTRMVGALIAHATSLGFELTFGEAYRSPEEAARLAAAGKGISKSLHTDRLAVDFNLFIGGRYQTDSEAHRLLGEYWESLGGTWGGRFGDGNHYSLAHGGRK